MSVEFDIVQKYLGKPYKHLGRDEKGYDCWGIVVSIYRDLGHEIMDLESYDRDWAEKGSNYFADNYSESWEKHTTPKMFDVALFCNKNNIACHAGIYIREGNMIHCSERVGVVISKVGRFDGKRIFDGYYRLKALHGHS